MNIHSNRIIIIDACSGFNNNNKQGKRKLTLIKFPEKSVWISTGFDVNKTNCDNKWRVVR